MDRNELKVQALLEKISSLTTNYENQVAELRVDVTLLSQEKQELANELSEVREQLEATRNYATEVGQGVSEEDSNIGSTD